MTRQRAAIYARYSTDLQSDKSIEDQVHLCRQYAERAGMEVVEVYSDAATSGASIAQRYGFKRLLTDAEARRFQIVIAEDVDRVSRNEADWHSSKQILDFHGVAMHVVHSGVVGDLDGSLRAMMSAHYIKNLALKVHRGLSGVIRDGRHAGGRAFGYDVVEGKPGEFTIDEAEADIVRRIFREAASGKTPRQIAHGLNADKVAAPRGKHWNASTLNGSRQRGYGVLHNELYIGKLVWNRVAMVKDPRTGKRISRPNPESAWMHKDAPSLRILTDKQWDAAHAMLRTGPRLTNKQRPKRLLSGIVRCGACGGGMVVKGADRSGKTRLRCSTRYESGTCDHARTYYMEDIEAVVLRGLREELANPKAISLYVQTYNEERAALAKNANARRAKAESRLAEVKRKINRIVERIADDKITDAEIDELMPPLRVERDRLTAELAEPVKVSAVALHPQTVRRYLTHIEALADRLKRATVLSEAGDAFRKIVSAVTVHPVAPGAPLDIEVTGSLGDLAAAPLPPAFRKGSSRGVSSGSGGGI